MSLIDEASLVQIPSGYKEDKLYSIIPSDGTGDFNFSRASSATRVNAEGLIEEVPVNLLQQSNSFTTNWDDNYVVLTSGQSGYDGTNDGWLLTGFAGTSEKRIRQNPAKTGICTLSVYAKAGTEDFLWLRGVTNSANVRVFYNLSNGTIANAGSAISSAITDVGNGWYRCEATIDQQAGFEFYIGISDSTSAVSSTTGNIYIQDAQINSGSTAKTYFPTTDGLNVPRIDYSNGCGSLLLEPQRSNLVTYSESFDNAYWNRVGASVTSGFTSPDGTTNAFKMTETSSTGVHYVGSSNINVTSGDDTTFSVFVKKGESNFIQLLFSGSSHSGSNFANFDLLNGVLGSVGSGVAKIESIGGFYRCSFTSQATATTATNAYIWKIQSATSSRAESYTGDGTSGVYIYGAQLEQSSYPTSYIISNSGSQTTRTADACNGAGDASTFNDSEGVLMAEIAAFEGANTDRQISVSDGSTSNRVVMALLSNGTQMQFVVASGGLITVNNTQTISTITSRTKIAFAYKANDFKIYANGLLIASDTSGAVPTGMGTLGFDRGDGNDKFYGKTKQLMVFDEALSNSELETLTSWTSFSEMAQALQYKTY